MSRVVEMRYDEEHGRWTARLGGRDYGMHCGECFELMIGQNMIPCRLEMDQHWYVIIEDVRLNLRTRDSYRVGL
jgi:hypothetical protein